MSVRLQDFSFVIKVDKASVDLGGTSPPPPPPPPPPPSNLSVGDASWADSTLLFGGLARVGGDELF